MSPETDNIRLRYNRRKDIPEETIYSPLNPAVYMSHQEKERALIRWIKEAGIMPVASKRVLEIGCGHGGNLLQLLRLGFKPQNLVGNELLEDRAQEARRLLPPAVRIMVGDGASLTLEQDSFDIVLQSTVFTSLLDQNFQSILADRMWSLVKPGGGVLWYDFIYDNPKNPDVRGVPFRRIRELFPDSQMIKWPVTLAPPVNRLVTRIHPALYGVFNSLPFLRTHLLCWIKKIG